jgi:hypothetical protein
MSVGIKCDACGHINPIGRLYCVRCGAQLNIKRIVAVGRTRARRRARLLRSAMLIALFAALFQMLRPAPMDGRPGTLEDANRLVARINRLYDAVNERRVAEETFGEAEVNAYLASLIAGPRERATDESLRQGLNAIRVRLAPDRVTVVWATRAGPAPLTFEVSGTPAAGPHGFRLERMRVRAGRLPLPGPVGRWAAGRLYRTFEKLETEREVLDALSELNVGERRAIAATGGRP